MNILRALDDPKVFAPFFKGDSWAAWRAFLAALFALPMTPEQSLRSTSSTLAAARHRSQPSHEGLADMWTEIRQVVHARRWSRVFLASFRDWRPFLGPGERAPSW